ncbi:oxioreductase [Spiroplasma clarkii]|uniref:Oxidoreductase n=1 Tax=Spiroplasma clarkii TaxID=2139 RepID=A0A1Y0L0T7_9MOLU|nr:Gfo/Idh/MocA family oxidoreductase [Spiroplasma clarkii]ARU91617.1 oxioreductase [Spiroplasma clarkii]ATX71011.1 oxidoreductase [Spiroplasma clarkii]
MIRIGIIGDNQVENDFLAALATVVDLKISCVYAASTSEAKAFINKHNLIAKPTNSFEVLVDEVDAVYICSAVGQHYQQAKYFLQQQKHVLIEKPLTLEFEQTLELCQIAQINNVVLLEAHRFLQTPILSKLFDLVNDCQPFFANLNVTKKFPYLNDLVHGDFLPPFDEINGKGTTYDLLIYPILLCIFLFGKVKDVKAMSSKLSNGTSLTNLVNLRHESDVLVNITCSASYQSKLFSEIVAQNLTIGLEDITNIESIMLFEKNSSEIKELIEPENKDELNSFVYLLRVFVKMILSNNNNLRDYLLGMCCETMRVLNLVEKNQQEIGEN